MQKSLIQARYYKKKRGQETDAYFTTLLMKEE